MNSLRRRLTVSYTVLVGAIISLMAIVLTVLAFDAVVRPTRDAIALGATDARAIIGAQPQIDADELARRIRNIVAGNAVTVFVMHGPGTQPGFRPQPAPGFGGPPGGEGPGGAGGPNGPAGAGGPNGPGPPSGGPGNDYGGDRALGPAILLSFTGLHPENVMAGRARIAIVPERGPLEARLRGYVTVLAIALALAFVAAWLIARWISGQAVAPLIAVTAELRRFARGDFTSNAVPLAGISDVGQLIEAYNGAAAQVAAAFDERERAEERMRRFVADAGHELRTPLSIITAYVEVLRKGGVDDAHVRAQAFATLTTESTRMRRLVDRLVALARLEQPETTQPAVVEVGALARDAVGAIAAARGGDIACEVESGTFVLADPADLHEAIANLVDNALKYGAGSAVRVAVEHERDTVAVRVIDHGPGIAPPEREKIFERFYRGAGQDEVEGSGLGLAIAARAAKRAGGDLALERSGGGETVFVLRVPLHVQINAAQMRYTG